MGWEGYDARLYCFVYLIHPIQVRSSNANIYTHTLRDFVVEIVKKINIENHGGVRDVNPV